MKEPLMTERNDETADWNLEDRIQQLEQRLEEHDHGGAGRSNSTKSGTIHPELDDQTIAP